jgi:hypothetical protein
MDRDHWAFGAGYVPKCFLPVCSSRRPDFLVDSPSPLPTRLCRSRRICPGIHVAERELWLAISRLLWTYDIRSVPDEPISLEEYDGEHGRTPRPYRVTLTPRHDQVQALLEAEQEVTLMKL